MIGSLDLPGWAGREAGVRRRVLAISTLGLLMMLFALASSLYMVLPAESRSAGDWVRSDLGPTHGRYEFVLDESLEGFNVLGCYGEINITSTSPGRAQVELVYAGESRTSELTLRVGEVSTVDLLGGIPRSVEYELSAPGVISLSSDIRASYQRPADPLWVLASAAAALLGAALSLSGLTSLLLGEGDRLR